MVYGDYAGGAGGFAQAGEFAGRGAERGAELKEKDRASQLSLQLDKIESVAKFGYLSPFADEFYPELSGMDYADRLKVINDNIMNAGSKNINDIVREGGWWLLEQIRGAGGFGGGGGGSMRLPDYHAKYSSIKSEIGQWLKNQNKDIDPVLADAIEAHNTWVNASNQPNIEPEIKEYGQTFYDLYGDPKARKEMTLDDIARANQNWQKMAQYVHNKWQMTGDDNYYIDNMLAIWAGQTAIQKTANLGDKQMFDEKMGLMQNPWYSVQTRKYKGDASGDALRTEQLKWFRQDFKGFSPNEPSFLSKSSGWVSQGLQPPEIEPQTGYKRSFKTGAYGSQMTFDFGTEDYFKEVMSKLGAEEYNNRWYIPAKDGKPAREVRGEDLGRFMAPANIEKKIERFTTYIPGYNWQKIPKDKIEEFAQKYGYSVQPNPYLPGKLFIGKKNPYTGLMEEISVLSDEERNWWEENYFRPKGKEEMKKLEEEDNKKKQQSQSYNKRQMKTIASGGIEQPIMPESEVDYNGIALGNLANGGMFG